MLPPRSNGSAKWPKRLRRWHGLLGFSYREGDAPPCDHVEAVRWFTKAVEAGDSHSMIHVGRMYAGYMSSPAQALPWFSAPLRPDLPKATSGSPISTQTRSPMFTIPPKPTNGTGSSPSIRRNSSRALLAIAQQHLDGLGVPCDVKMAKLMAPAKSSAHREATKLLRNLMINSCDPYRRLGSSAILSFRSQKKPCWLTIEGEIRFRQKD